MREVYNYLVAIPKPVIFAITSVLLLGLVYSVWYNAWSPSPEQVFWQTIDKNLRSRSLTTATQVTYRQHILADSQLELNFAPDSQASWFQEVLTYNPDLSINPAQIRNYQQLGIVDLPDQEWYRQEVKSRDDLIYLQHYFRVQPRDDDYNDKIRDDLEIIPYGQTWHSYDISNFNNPNVSLQRFLMNTSVNDGFFYGFLKKHDREALIDQLRSVYQIDFDQAEKIWLDNQPHYVYQFQLDYSQLSQALIDYFNIHLPPEATPLEAANILQAQPVTYKVTIDVRSRRIKTIERPVIIPVGSYTLSENTNLNLIAHFSALIQELGNRSRDQLMVTTKILQQNQLFEIEIPEAQILEVELFKDQQGSS